MWLAGGLAVVAAGVVLIALAFVEDPRRVSAPSRRGTVTVEDLRHHELPVTWRGYDRGHVDALLARAARTLEDAQHYGPAAAPGDDGHAAPDETSTAPPSFLAGPLGARPAIQPEPSGEELEDRGGDGAGRLDG